MFADDVKIYVVIDDLSDCILLQTSLDKLVIWANRWQLKVSINKCAAMHFGTSKINFAYNIDSINLPDLDCNVDLGITFNRKLKFSQHISCIVSRAHQRASLILRCFKCREPATLCRAFKVYVRPLVEYCSQVWSPMYFTDILKIERVQRRFTRSIRGMNGYSYTERCNKLNLETLESRRLKADMVMVFKIMKGLIDIDRCIFEFYNISNLRGHTCKLYKPISSINCRTHSFVSRIVETWNALPQTAIDAPNIACFKHVLYSFNFNKYLHVK